MKKRIGGLIILLLMLALVGCKGNQEANHTHEYGEWEITRETSCAVAGVETRTCACGEKETRRIEALAHTPEKVEGIEPTCTTVGKTEGSRCSVCDATIVEAEILPEAHKEEVLPAVAVTCTRAGKGEGSRCTLCGETVVRQAKIRATGHNYQSGKCTKCNKAVPDTAVALLIDQFNEAAPANFITKKAYPGGTTISFSVYLPEGAPWWGFSWTKDPNKAGIYDWASEGNGTLVNTKTGVWQECSVTLPDDNNKYYIFLMGEKGAWNGQEMLIDDVTLTNKAGKVIGKDDFDYGIDAGLFNVSLVNDYTGMAAAYAKERCAQHKEKVDKAVAPVCDKAGKTKGSHCTVCGKILKAQKEIPALGHKWNEKDVCTVCGKDREDLVAALNVDKLSDIAPMNFITKEAYPGGSKVTFDVYAPEGATWWAVSWTTNPSDVSLYKWTEGLGESPTYVRGEWTQHSVTLPNDGKEYYIYFVGAKGEWGGKELQVNNFTVTGKNGKVLAKDEFDNGIFNGLFEITANDLNTDEVVVREIVKDSLCKDGHTVVKQKGKKPTCTEAGTTAGSYCSACGTILVEQKHLPANGHTWDENGKCTICKEKLMNRAVEIHVDELIDADTMNFITSSAYAGGSTVSFDAYVPEGTTWWSVSWTTHPSDSTLYKWAEGYGQSMPSAYNIWKRYSVTLPDDGQNYYIYFTGAKGEWNGKTILIDNVKITSKTGEVVAKDDFNNGIKSGIFKINTMNVDGNAVAVSEKILGDACLHKTLVQEENKEPTCTEAGYMGRTYCKDCNETINDAIAIQPNGHNFENGICLVCGVSETDKAVIMQVANLNEAPLNFVTKKAYPGGSTVTFMALVPEGITNRGWWGVAATTEPSKTDVYAIASGYNLFDASKVGKWATYSVTLPDDGKNYYITIGGAPGTGSEWVGKKLIVDDFKVQAADGNVLIEEDFNITSFEDSAFDVQEKGLSNAVAVTLEHIQPKDIQEEPKNRVAKLEFAHFHEVLTNFITKEKYPGGSVVTFEAFVPEGLGDNNSWWGAVATTNASNASIYDCASANLGVSQAGQWATYTITLPSGSESYYIAIGGCCGSGSAWNGKALLIDNFKVTNADGNVLAEDNFDQGFAEGLFSTQTGYDYVNGVGATAVSLQAREE